MKGFVYLDNWIQDRPPQLQLPSVPDRVIFLSGAMKRIAKESGEKAIHFKGTSILHHPLLHRLQGLFLVPHIALRVIHRDGRDRQSELWGARPGGLMLQIVFGQTVAINSVILPPNWAAGSSSNLSNAVIRSFQWDWHRISSPCQKECGACKWASYRAWM